MSTDKQARTIGRILRFLTGALLIAASASHLVGAPAALQWQTFAVIAGLFVSYAAVHVAVLRFASGLNAWLGGFFALAPVVAAFLALGAPGGLGALLYIGVSLVAAAVRADAGCEVMTLPGMCTGRRTHLVCLVFSPFDWVEEKLPSARANGASKAV